MAKGGKRGARMSNKTLNKAKKVLGNKKMARAKKGMDTFFQRCRTEATIAPSQGVTTSNYLYAYWSLIGTGANSLYDNAQFQQNALVYDKYRVNRVKVTITPKANVFDAANGQDDALYTLTGSGVVHTCLDRDGPGPSSTAQIVQRASYRKYSMLKKFSRSYSIKYPTGIWFDCNGDRNGPTAQGQVVSAMGAIGGVTIYAENFIEDSNEIFNEPWAEAIIEWDVVFQGRTPQKTTFQFNEGGEVIGYTVTPNLPEEKKPLSLVLGVRGTVADARLVDTVLSNTEVAITHGEDQ